MYRCMAGAMSVHYIRKELPMMRQTCDARPLGMGKPKIPDTSVVHLEGSSESHPISSVGTFLLALRCCWYSSIV